MSLFALRRELAKRKKPEGGEFFLGLLVATVLSLPIWLAILLLVM